MDGWKLIEIAPAIATVAIAVMVWLQTGTQNRISTAIQAQSLRITLLDKRVNLYSRYRAIVGSVILDRGPTFEGKIDAHRIAHEALFIFDAPISEFLARFAVIMDEAFIVCRRIEGTSVPEKRTAALQREGELHTIVRQMDEEAKAVFAEHMAVGKLSFS